MLTKYQPNCAIIYCLKAHCRFYLRHIGNLIIVAIIEVLLVNFIAAKKKFWSTFFGRGNSSLKMLWRGQRAMRKFISTLETGAKQT